MEFALLSSLRGTREGNRAAAAPQLCYDMYRQLLFRLPNFSLACAAQVLTAADKIGSPPPALLSDLVETAAALMRDTDVKVSNVHPHYLAVLGQFSVWSEKASLLTTNQLGRQAGDSSKTPSQTAADLPVVHQYLAVHRVIAYTRDLQEEMPVSLQALGQLAAKGSVSAGQLARQLLQHHIGKQYDTEEATALLCMAVNPATIASLQDMTACLLAVIKLVITGANDDCGAAEPSILPHWLKRAKGALGRLLWQKIQQGWASADLHPTIACLSAWLLLRPVDQLAFGSIPFQMILSSSRDAVSVLWSFSAVWGPGMSQPTKPASDLEMQALSKQLSQSCTAGTGCEVLQLAGAACQLRQLAAAGYKDVYVEQLSEAAADALFACLSDDSNASKCVGQLDAEQLQQLATLVLQLLPSANNPKPVTTAYASFLAHTSRPAVAALPVLLVMPVVPVASQNPACLKATEQHVVVALRLLLKEMAARVQDVDSDVGISCSTSSHQQQQQQQQQPATALQMLRSGMGAHAWGGGNDTDKGSHSDKQQHAGSGTAAAVYRSPPPSQHL